MLIVIVRQIENDGVQSCYDSQKNGCGWVPMSIKDLIFALNLSGNTGFLIYNESGILRY